MRYGVSFEFLQYFGLRGVHELPPVEKLETLPIAAGTTENTEVTEKAESVIEIPADNDQVVGDVTE